MAKPGEKVLKLYQRKKKSKTSQILISFSVYDLFFKNASK